MSLLSDQARVFKGRKARLETVSVLGPAAADPNAEYGGLGRDTVPSGSDGDLVIVAPAPASVPTPVEAPAPAFNPRRRG